MTLERAAATCLTITAGDDHIDGLHLDTVAQAEDAVRSSPGVVAEVDLQAEPCWLLVCDGCGEEAEDQERGLHFESVEDALTWAREVVCWTTDGRRLWCGACRAEAPSLYERIPVIEGQMSLL